MIYVLDASAVLRLTDNQAGMARVRELLDDAADERATVLLSAVNWGEVVAVIYRRSGPTRGEEIIDQMVALPVQIVDVTQQDARRAGILKSEFKIPYADAFAASLALERSAILVTADYDFKTLAKGMIQIEFLPQK
jgi:uncharacterized protein